MRYVASAILAAVLYALSIPFSKMLIECGVDSGVLAGLLYLGAGLGMFAAFAFRKARGSDEGRNLRRSDGWYVLLMVLLDIAAPLLLMHGLVRAGADVASLLGNFEIAATAIIAAVFFREHVDGRLWLAIALMTLSCVLLSLSDVRIASDGFDAGGGVFVLAAACCWGVENNCTGRLSQRSPVQVVAVKGIGSGAGALAAGVIAGGAIPSAWFVGSALLLGFLSYGLSICSYVYAQRGLGAARTSAYYSAAPFVGVAVSWLLFGVTPTTLFVPALLLMAVGSYLSLPKEP